jgi:hypothetical protein
MAWNYSNTEVYSGNAPTTWTDLDLSSVVGSQRALVLLFIDSSSSNALGFRPNGDTDDWYTTENVSGGMTGSGAGRNHVLVLTDTSGIVEWKMGSATATTVDLIGYTNDITYSGQQVYSGSIPLTSTQLDLSSIVGNNKALVLLKQKYSSGTARSVGYKKNGESKDCVTAEFLNLQGACNVALIDASRAGGFIVSTDENGIIEFSAVGGASDYEVSVLCYATDCWYDKNTTVVSGQADLVTSQVVEIDLSSYIGSARALVLLSLDCTPAAGGVFPWFNFSEEAGQAAYRLRGGCSANHVQYTGSATNTTVTVLSQTSATGVVRWYQGGTVSAGTTWDVRLLGALVLESTNSVTGHSNFISPQSQNQNISFSINSSEVGISQTTIDVTLTDPNGDTHLAIVDGSFQAGYAGTIAANANNGFDITISTYPDIVGSWTVDVYAEDFLGSQ